MSVTTTANPIHYNLHATLADYELHHSNATEEVDTSLNRHPAPASETQNPSDWPTEHRRIPAYRPVNTELDQGERRVYQNGIERAFIGVMFTGVFLQSVRSDLEFDKAIVLIQNSDCVEGMERISGQSLEHWVQTRWGVVNRSKEEESHLAFSDTMFPNLQLNLFALLAHNMLFLHLLKDRRIKDQISY
jgi:hypothetical protein